MTAHPKAALLRELYEVAATNDKPWKEFEYQHPRSGWHACAWLTEVLREDYPVRRKPRTIRIGNYDVPEPLRVAPPNNTAVYVADSTLERPICGSYTNDPCYKYAQWLDAGLLYLTKEAAQLHIDALLSFTRRDGE